MVEGALTGRLGAPSALALSEAPIGRRLCSLSMGLALTHGASRQWWRGRKAELARVALAFPRSA
eukprot:9164133-Alexandrium_andersonii.AAC.1